MLRKKAGWEVHEDAVSIFEQILEAAPHKTAAIQPFISYLIKYKSKTNKTCWKSRNELISDILLWTTMHEHISVGYLAKIYFHQLCAETEFCVEDLPKAINDRQLARVSKRNQFDLVWLVGWLDFMANQLMGYFMAMAFFILFFC